MFPGAGCVVALVDRFAQHCHRVEILGESWRDTHRLDSQRQSSMGRSGWPVRVASIRGWLQPGGLQFDSSHVVSSPVMGAVACELHGIQFMAMTSPAVARAVLANERWTRRELVRVRTEFWDDQEPRARCWLDRTTAGDRDDELLPASVVFELAGDAVCAACFDAWLADNGVDNAYSPDELRFVRIAEALENAMRPTLEPRFTTMMNALVSWEGPSGMGFSTRRGRPFTAYVSSHLGRVVSLAVHDRGDHLVASVEVSPDGVVMPEALQVALVSAELDESALAALAAWSDAVSEALGRGGDGNTFSG